MVFEIKINESVISPEIILGVDQDNDVSEYDETNNKITLKKPSEVSPIFGNSGSTNDIYGTIEDSYVQDDMVCWKVFVGNKKIQPTHTASSELNNVERANTSGGHQFSI